MIRYAKADDLPALRFIWNACFPADVGFGVFFFSELYKPEQSLVFDDGKVTSMLHMLPFTRSDGKPVTYIYGVGTLPEYRRRGQSAALIKEALRVNDICFLIPQEKWLFGFYEQFGFKTTFYKREFSAAGLEEARRAGNGDIPLLNKYYQDALDVRVERSSKHWENMLENGIFMLDGGYAIVDGNIALEAFGPATSSKMTGKPFGMANQWAGESAYLNFMYN